MKSLWQVTASMPSFPQLQGDVKTDVLVIGGGMTGLLTAYFLQQKGVSCILVEKDNICGGTTGNTTAKITSQHGLIYSKVFKSEGLEGARLYLEANNEAIAAYSRLCKNISCNFERRDNYVYSTSDRERLEDELAVIEKIGGRARFCEKLPLPFKTEGAVCFPDQAQFHPLKFAAEIAKGLNIYEHTLVREMIGDTAVTDYGKIRADKVIVATHFPFINKHGSYFLKLYQHRSYVIALENAPYVGGMYVDENHKGFSFRNYENLLLLGGGAHRTGKQGGGWTELRRFAKMSYPLAEEKYFWAAQDCMSLDDVPYIGRYSKRTAELYVASGFNKWGMTGSMAAALNLSRAATGEKSDYERIFSPSRSILKPQLLVNGFVAVTNLLTISKKRCPHLGCALKWNSAEHSWDCACHGSRFDEKGKVLDNPANGNLKK